MMTVNHLVESAKGLSMLLKQLSEELDGLGLKVNLKESLRKGPEFLLSELDDLTGGRHELNDLVYKTSEAYDRLIDDVLSK